MRTAPLAAAIAVLCGCGIPGRPLQARPVNFHRAPAADVAHVRRVLVLPVDAGDSIHDVGFVQDALLQQMTKLQRFQLTLAPDDTDEQRRLNQAMRRGRLSTEALIGFGRRFGVDGILISSVLACRPYPPAHLGMRVQLTSTHTGQTLWVAEGMWDASDASAMEDLEHFARSVQAEEASMHGWEINLISPRRFAAFVAHRLVSTWRQR